jgi:NAD(P)H-dependent FMN reductase
MTSTVHVLAISGSLRAASRNRAFCEAAARLAPAGITVEVYGALGAIPPFNADHDDAPGDAVADLRRRVARADALLIASPEYAHGVSGGLKNALDWLVSVEDVVGTPIAVVNTSPRAQHADASLREILGTMAMTLVPDASVTVPVLGRYATSDEIVTAPDAAQSIVRVLEALRAFVLGAATGRTDRGGAQRR